MTANRIEKIAQGGGGQHSRLFACLIAFVLALLVVPTVAYAAEGDAVADGSTINSWNGYVEENNTQTVGRIWTDKTVSAGNIELTGDIQDGIIEMDAGADFLVGLSALSSTSNLTTATNQPLDIVLVLDTSGSMAYAMDGSENLYNEVYGPQLDTSKTYYISSGWNGYREVTYSSDENEWGYRDGRRWRSVTPKENQGDWRNTQFYERESSRLEALQSAVKGFVSQTLEENQKQGDESLMHRIGIVTFSGGAEIEMGLTPVTADAAGRMNNTLDGLRANGGTEADEGIEAAQREMQSARDNAQKVVIFFTDGEPGNYAFDGTRAASVINTAGEMKEEDTLIYTIGIFEGADPSDTSDKTNNYMNAASSNYPDATATGTKGGADNEWNPSDGTLSVDFGVREKDADYYKATSDADELNNIFREIFEDIKTPGSSPTETTDGFGMDGYITFTDTLGKYMEVKGDTMTVVFANEKKIGTRQEDGTIFKFEGKFEGNGVYQEADLSNLIVTVTPGQDGEGDTVTVKVPAQLIPLRNYGIDTDEDGTVSMSTAKAYPIRIFYSVGLKDGVDELLAKPDANMTDYIAANKTENGEVNFYSNDYTKGSDTGNTTAEFTPATSNKFYYFTENTPLYTDPECTQRATLNDLEGNSGVETVYYKNDYFKQEGTAGIPVPDHISIPVAAFTTVHAGHYGSDAEGAFMKAGTARLNRTSDFDCVKGEDQFSSNETGTATKYIFPDWVGEKSIKVSLGNNGKRSVEQPATLEVSKNVEAADGFDGKLADYQQKDFTFNFTFTNVPNDSYQAEVKNAEGATVGNPFELSIQDGAATHTLKHGETLYVYGLPANATYTVAEDLTTTPGFTSQVTSGTAEGNLAAGQTAAVEFTNTYQASPVTELPAEYAISVEKILENRNWRDADEFTFGISGVNDTPAFNPATVTIKGTDANKTASFSKVTFDKPGEYTYDVWEQDEPESPIPGINYSNESYRVVITVADDGEGALEVTGVTMTKMRGEGEQGVDVPNRVATFTNSYAPDDATQAIVAVKSYDDKSGGANPFTPGKFKVQLKALGGYETVGGSSENYTVEAADVPMPADAAEGSTTVEIGNVSTEFRSKDITFDGNDVGFTYEYELTELPGSEEGMTYDTATKRVVKLVVEEVPAQGDDPVTIKATQQPAKDDVVFENVYNPTDVVLSDETKTAISGTKTMVGRDMLGGENFEFVLTPTGNTLEAIDSGAVMGITEDGLKATASGGEKGVTVPFAFGGEAGITFTKVGTYTFDMKENAPSDTDNLKYDRHTCEVTVTVTLNKAEGKLEASVVYGSVDAPTNSFTNTYTNSTSYGELTNGGLEVSKTMTGRTMDNGEFAFTIAGVEHGGSVPAADAEAKLADADKNFTNDRTAASVAWTVKKLADVTFTQDDAGKTFSYLVDEAEPTDAEKKPGVTYDKSEYRVDITVSDDGEGNMSAKTTITRVKDAEGATANDTVNVVAFANAYQPGEVTIDSGADNALAVTKQVEGAPATEAFNFELTLDGDASAVFEGSGEGKTAFDGMSATTQESLADGATETLKFGDITFTEAGTYTFKVTETSQDDEKSGWTYDNEPKTITVVVTDKAEDGTYADTLRIESITGNNPTVTNTYAAKPVIIGGEGAEKSLTVQKTVMGRDNAEDFSFTLAPVDEGDDKWGNVEPVAGFEKTVNITDDFKAGEDKRATWGAISFNAVGIYDFTVEEVQGRDDVVDGWKYDNHTATIIVTVTDDGYDGQLDATIEYKNDTAEVDADKNVTDAAAFTNSYTAGPNEGVDWTSAALTKVFTGKAWEDEEFEFAIEADSAKTPDGAAIDPIPMPAEDTKTVGAPEDGGNTATFDFGNITFTTPGTYIYKVTETKGDLPGVTYDGGTATVTVEVSDSGAGKLAAVATVANGEFANEYKSSLDYNAKGGLTLVKNLDGRSIAADQFSFEVAPTNDDAKAKTGADAKTITVSAASMNKKTGVATSTASVFDSLVFNEADAGKTFTYTVKENGTAPTGYTYDGTIYTVEIAVADDGKGVMTVTTTVSAAGMDDVVYTYTVADEDAPRAEVVFNNSYDATGSIPATGEGALKARKELTGRDLVSGEFTFTVKDDKGNQVATGANDANGAISFGEISYSIDSLKDMVAQGIAEVTDENGVATYAINYTVAEDIAGLAEAGVTATVSSFSITVNVVDNGSGTLAVSIDYGNAGSELVFENTYGAKDAKNLVVKGQKVVKGVEGKDLNVPALKGGEFTFTLSGEAGAPMPENATAQNDSAGNVEFDPITYTLENVWPEDVAADNGDEGGVEALSEPVGEPRAKTFTYTVAESGYMPGVENENGVKTFTVTVTDDGKGNLTAAVTEPSGGAAFTFTNTYDVTETSSSPTDGAVTVAKSLAGRDLQAGEFEFTMTDQMTGEVVATAKNEADGTVSFPAIPFSEQGTHTYTIAETDNKLGGVTYDPATYTATATVTDDGQGNLSVAWTVTRGEEQVKEIVFENAYEAAPTSIVFNAKKELVGRELKEGEFTFELRENGEVIGAATNDAEGKVVFEAVPYTEVGSHIYEIAEVKGSDSTITYDDAVYTVTVNVTDKDDSGAATGKLSAADWSYGENGAPVFENTYTAPEEPKPLPTGDGDGNTLVKTGDAAPTALLAGGALAAAAVVCGTMLRLRRSRRDER